MSIDLWVYRTGSATTQHIIGKRSGCSGGIFNYQIVLDPGNGGICFAANNGAAVMACSSGGDSDLPMDAWTHLAATFDGGAMRLYIDAQEAASTASTLGTPDSATLRIGTSGTCGDFDGLLDEVEIHDRALSRDEVYAVYTAGAHGKCDLPDTEPDPFHFTDQTGVPLSSVRTSSQITVSGINTATTIDITTCTSAACEYAVNDGTWTSTAGTVVEGDTVRVRQTSGATLGAVTDLTLDIGGITDTFRVITLQPQTLTVSLIGDGTGSVTSSPAGIDCPAADCSAIFATTETVTLTPAPEEGSVFSGWRGDPDCSDGVVEMYSDVDCTAVFDDPLFADGFESGDTSEW